MGIRKILATDYEINKNLSRFKMKNTILNKLSLNK